MVIEIIPSFINVSFKFFLSREAMHRVIFDASCQTIVPHKYRIFLFCANGQHQIPSSHTEMLQYITHIWNKHQQARLQQLYN